MNFEAFILIVYGVLTVHANTEEDIRWGRQTPNSSNGITSGVREYVSPIGEQRNDGRRGAVSENNIHFDFDSNPFFNSAFNHLNETSKFNNNVAGETSNKSHASNAAGRNVPEINLESNPFFNHEFSELPKIKNVTTGGNMNKLNEDFHSLSSPGYTSSKDGSSSRNSFTGDRDITGQDFQDERNRHVEIDLRSNPFFSSLIKSKSSRKSKRAAKEPAPQNKQLGTPQVQSSAIGDGKDNIQSQWNPPFQKPVTSYYEYYHHYYKYPPDQKENPSGPSANVAFIENRFGGDPDPASADPNQAPYKKNTNRGDQNFVSTSYLSVPQSAVHPTKNGNYIVVLPQHTQQPDIQHFIPGVNWGGNQNPTSNRNQNNVVTVDVPNINGYTGQNSFIPGFSFTGDNANSNEPAFNFQL